MGSPRPDLARGTAYMARLMMRCNNNAASRYHEHVIKSEIGQNGTKSGQKAAVFPVESMLNRTWQAVGLHLRLELRHIVPKHDDVVLLAVDVPDMVAEQRLGPEAEALEEGDRCLLVDRHLHREF